jgi:hypothetical protein
MYLELWILQEIGRTLWTGDQPCRKGDIHASSGILAQIQLFEWVKTCYALDRSATVIGSFQFKNNKHRKAYNIKLKPFFYVCIDI